MTAGLWICVSLIFLAPVMCQDEDNLSDSKDFTLSGAQASVQMKRFPWAYKDPLILEMDFETRSYFGQLALLSASNVEGEKNFQMLVEVQQRLLRVVMLNSEDEVVAEVRNLNNEISNGVRHKLLITLNVAENGISVDLDRIEQRVTITGSLEVSETVDISLFIGRSPEFNDELPVNGCVGNIKIWHGQSSVDVEVSEMSTEVSSGCENPCAKDVQCNGGVCLNMYNGKGLCNCIGTEKEGPFCDQEGSVVTLPSDLYLEYILQDSDEHRQIQNISVTFKVHNCLPWRVRVVRPRGGLIDEIVVNVESSGSVVVYTQELTTTISFPDANANDGKWHKLSLNLNYGKETLIATLDGEIQSRQWSISDDDYIYFENSLFFGGASEDEDLGKGFQGCLKEIYEGTTSVLNLLKQRDTSRVIASSEPFYNCDLDVLAVIPEEKEETRIPDEAPEEVGEPEQPETNGGWVGPKENNCENVNCENGGTCFIDGMTYNAECECAEGFAGTRCQFSDLPKHCTELFLWNERGSGVYEIDLDGSGPMNSTYVQCLFDNSSMGHTVISHNFPNQTTVRAGETYEDSVIPISYRFMSGSYLQVLMDLSQSCKQYVRYDCLRAPLNFNDKTWFSSVKKDRFGQIGTDPGKCPCAETGSCEGMIVDYDCNCDAEENIERRDEGWLVGDLSAVTSVTVLQVGDQDWGRLTLGPLMCTGTNAAETSVTFSNPESYLALPSWKGKDISFWFKMSKSSGLMLRQVATDGQMLEIAVHDGHIAELKFRFGNDEAVTVVRTVSQGRLNDSAWHRILLELKLKEMRFSVDRSNEFRHIYQELDASRFDRPLSIGGTPGQLGGFVGCIRDVTVDGENLDLREVTETTDFSGISVGCPDNCSPNPCQNLAECAENFEMGTYKCICVNPWAHSGRDCQNNVNLGTAVSFHDRDKAFIKYQDLDSNPVTQSTTFSFRTDQASALLSYAFDENYNFVEVHLWDDNKVSLTVSYNRTIKRCTVTIKKREFSDMEWNQVTIQYESEYTALFVDYEMCIVNGSRVMSDTYITQFEEGTEYINVFPPRAPVDPGNNPIDKFTLLYVAGVPKPPLRRRTFYYTDLPSLLGCIRGFQIGNRQVDLRTAGERSGNVRDGCDTAGCNSLICNHGGHCAVAWSQRMTASCDCSKTSYSGPFCHRDVGLHFTGEAVLRYDMGKVLRSRAYLPPTRPPSTLRFAFSTDSEGASGQLVYLRMKDNIIMDVLLTAEGWLEFKVHIPGSDVAGKIFKGNYADAKRHFVFMKFRGAIDVAVDSVSVEIPVTQRPMDLSDLELVVLGGSGRERLEAAYSNYVGCISNAIIDFRIGSDLVFEPIVYYTEPDEANGDTVRVIPEGATLNPGACAQYLIGEPIAAPPATFPPWNVPLKRDRYIPATNPDEGGGGSGISEKDETGNDPECSPSVSVVAIVLGVLLVVVIVIVLGYLWYVKCYKNRESTDVTRSHYEKGRDVESPPPKAPEKVRDSSAEPDEKERLNGGGSSEPELNLDPVPIPSDPNTGGSPLYSVPHRPAPVSAPVPPPHLGPLPTHMEVPEATENLDEPEIHPYPSPQATGSGSSVSDDSSYVTSQAEFPPPPTEQELQEMGPSKPKPDYPPLEFSYERPPKSPSIQPRSPITPSRKLVYVPPPHV